MKIQLCGRDENVFDLNDQGLRLPLLWQKNEAATYISSSSVIVIWYDSYNIFFFLKIYLKDHTVYTLHSKYFFFVYIDCIFQIMLQLYHLA